MAHVRLKSEVLSSKATGAAAHYRQVRATTVRLAAPLSVEDQQCQSMLLTSPTIRPYVRSIIERFRGQTPVMSQNEVHPRARLKTVGTI